MTSSNNIERVTLYIDSSNRTTGVPENFGITLNNPVRKVIQVEIVSAEIPYTFYNINTTNNEIVWTDGTNMYIAGVEPGNYPIAKFVPALQAAMNASMAGFTITYSKETYRLTFANATAFSIDLTNLAGTSTMARAIGLLADTPIATSTTLTGAINISGPKYLMIRSAALTDPKITRAYLNANQDNILYKIAIAGAPGDMLVEKNAYSSLLRYGVRNTIKNIDFQLIDDRGNQVDLNGQEWSMTVNMVTG